MEELARREHARHLRSPDVPSEAARQLRDTRQVEVVVLRWRGSLPDACAFVICEKGNAQEWTIAAPNWTRTQGRPTSCLDDLWLRIASDSRNPGTTLLAGGWLSRNELDFVVLNVGLETLREIVVRSWAEVRDFRLRKFRNAVVQIHSIATDWGTILETLREYGYRMEDLAGAQ